MQRLIITTTCRNAPVGEPSGFLYIYDPEQARVIQRGAIIEPPFRDIDPNPRGGMRGGKGIAVRGGEIFLANSVAVFRFNRDWDLQGVITHPACAGIHDILIDNHDHLWVSSARNDLLFKFDLAGKLLEYTDFRGQPGLRQSLAWNQPGVLNVSAVENGKIDFRDPRTHDLTFYDGAHLNSVNQFSDGRLAVSLGFVVNRGYSTLMAVKTWLVRHGLWSGLVEVNQVIRRTLALRKDMHSQLVVQPVRGKSAVLALADSGVFEPCLVLDQATTPAHSLLALPDGTGIYLNTTRGEIIHFDPLTKAILSARKVTDHFLRGATQLDEVNLIVGSQNGLILYNRIQQKIVDQVSLSEHEGESVFAIHPLSDEFSIPPASFEKRIGKLVGFRDREPIFE